jgi:hypothetical protein
MCRSRERQDTLLGLSCRMQAQLMFDGRTLASNAMHSLPKCQDRLLRDAMALSQTTSPTCCTHGRHCSGLPRCGPCHPPFIYVDTYCEYAYHIAHAC